MKSRTKTKLATVLWPNFKRTIDGFPNMVIANVQDHKTKELLMTAFMDEHGWEQSLKTGKVSLFSTSKGKSWVKGEESGNFMVVKEIRLDCDGDAILFFVDPQGAGVACHTEARSCFYRSVFMFQPNLMDAPKAGRKEDLGVTEFKVADSIER